MPLFIVLIGGVSMIPASSSPRSRCSPQTIGIVDHYGVLGLREEVAFSIPPRQLPIRSTRRSRRVRVRMRSRPRCDASTIASSYASLEEAQGAVRRDEISSAIDVSKDFSPPAR